MKRLLACATLIVAVTLAVTALAATRRYEGAVRRGGSVSFQATVHRGEIRRVHDFAWKNIPVRCDQGKFRARGRFTFSAPVNDRRKFRFSGANATSAATAKGRFNDTGQKARGTFRIRGDLEPGTADNCDSGKRHWRAHHGA